MSGKAPTARDGKAVRRDEAEWQRLDLWLWCARVAKARSDCARLVEDGAIRLNRQSTVKAHARLRPGDVLTLPLPRRRGCSMRRCRRPELRPAAGRQFVPTLARSPARRHTKAPKHGHGMAMLRIRTSTVPMRKPWNRLGNFPRTATRSAE